MCIQYLFAAVVCFTCRRQLFPCVANESIYLWVSREHCDVKLGLCFYFNSQGPGVFQLCAMAESLKELDLLCESVMGVLSQSKWWAHGGLLVRWRTDQVESAEETDSLITSLIQEKNTCGILFQPVICNHICNLWKPEQSARALCTRLETQIMFLINSKILCRWCTHGTRRGNDNRTCI